MPDEKGEIKEYLDGIRVRGGGDTPESALEALIKAKKHFGKEAYRRAILLFTNAPYKEPSEYVPYAEKNDRAICLSKQADFQLKGTPAQLPSLPRIAGNGGRRKIFFFDR